LYLQIRKCVNSIFVDFLFRNWVITTASPRMTTKNSFDG
jgi:hypothetical protein